MDSPRRSLIPPPWPEQLFQTGVFITRPEGKELHREGDVLASVQLITQGRVALVHRGTLIRDGSQLIHEVCEPGAALGARAIFEPEARSVDTALTQTHVGVFRMNVSELRRFLDEDQDGVAREIYKLLGKQLARSHDDSVVRQRIASKDAEVRVRFALNELFKAHGQTLKISQQELADVTGMCRENVCRVLARLKDAGIVRVRQGEIQILQPELLLGA